MKATLIYDRQSRSLVEEKVLGDTLMRLAYLSPGRALFQLLFFRTAWLSRLLGCYASSALSRRHITKTIAGLGIDVTEFKNPPDSFHSFNEFFVRHLKNGVRPFDPTPEALCSPADRRLLVFPELQDDTCLPVKGKEYTIAELFGPEHASQAEAFRGGALAVCRLCPADYHRFHFPAAGSIEEEWAISGRLHSVHPLALGLNIPVFVQNRRVVSLLRLETFGIAAFIEVGAFGVAAIVQTHDEKRFGKMDEKGYFEFGGSTIILVFQKGAVTFDEDLVQQSTAGRETLVKAGERIARQQVTDAGSRR